MNNEEQNNINETKEAEYRDKLILEVIKQYSNPFINLSVKQVAEDLEIGENLAYELFKQEDFPSINIGRKWKITLIAYLLWKTKKQVWKGDDISA